MITLHVPQPQLLLTPLVFYNMHAGKITLIGKIPDSYSVFDMSDIRLSILKLACFPLEVRTIWYLSSSRTHWGGMSSFQWQHHIIRSVFRFDML